ncbi:MAG: hypothetical protein R6V50_06565 [Thermoplasmatota archaeon]
MENEGNIFIKIQIEKSKTSNNFILTLNFDRNAPNFLADANQTCWAPTSQEMDFLIDMFQMVSKNNNFFQRKDIQVKEMVYSTKDKSQNSNSNDMKQIDSSENKPKIREEETISENRDSISDMNEIEKKDESFVQVNDKISDEDFSNKKKDKNVFVQIDDKKIDEFFEKITRDTKKDSSSHEEDK